MGLHLLKVSRGIFVGKPSEGPLLSYFQASEISYLLHFGFHKVCHFHLHASTFAFFVITGVAIVKL